MPLGRIVSWFAAAVLCAAPLISSVRSAPPAPPHFRTAADARAWGEKQERLGNYSDAALAYEIESGMRLHQGDPQAAEVERHRALRLATDLRLAIPVSEGPPVKNLAKWEPAQGCYLGVRDDFEGDYYGKSTGNADDFARRIDRPVAIAFDYDSYGRPFPIEWARREAKRGRGVQIAWEPKDIANVRDDEYLNKYAEDAARSGAPVFLRFGGEMNGGWTSWGRSPAAYRRAFRLVHEVMARHAPNVAMVWAPNAVPVSNIDEYYPGDDAVDWVGVSLYVVRFYDDHLNEPAWRDGPVGFIEPFYQKYAARKPLCLVECGVTRRSRVEGADADAFAAARWQDLFDAVRIRYPRLKMVCFFDRDNLTGAIPGRRLNDYALPDGSAALASVRDAVADPYFLGEVSDHPASSRAYLPVTTSFPPGYHGSVSASVCTYSLKPILNIQRGARTLRVTRPYRFAMPAGQGALVVTVRDEKGRAAKVQTVFAP
ncbi:hypothetical protein CCAX7_29890 [Capsulimonas corticalis]|uniref:Uncharacterized protein n=1 Tax=Capsulimonas corticalis TaxID=2219043 RepID=A0A402CSW2_9BACT|nr:glycosyl hydrolase [Capsulimonas corticalis]BDI30938.1 hypothetical protein CCAX7_29890 [Capsulimonas corticalis]